MAVWKKLCYEEDAVLKSLFNANTILAAASDDTPAALTVSEQTIVGRITGGNIAALTASQALSLLGVEPSWTSVPYSASNFSGSESMVWTVDSADIKSFKYIMIGPHTMLVAFSIEGSTISGTVNSSLKIVIPNSKTSQALIVSQSLISDGGGWSLGYTSTTALGSYIYIGKMTNYVAGSDNISVWGSIIIEV